MQKNICKFFIFHIAFWQAPHTDAKVVVIILIFWLTGLGILINKISFLVIIIISKLH